VVPIPRFPVKGLYINAVVAPNPRTVPIEVA